MSCVRNFSCQTSYTSRLSIYNHITDTHTIHKCTEMAKNFRYTQDVGKSFDELGYRSDVFSKNKKYNKYRKNKK